MTDEPSATPWSFCWTDDWTYDDLAGRAVELARSMAAVKCKNKYPTGVIGREARAHYNEARLIAQGIEARRAMTAADDIMIPRKDVAYGPRL